MSEFHIREATPTANPSPKIKAPPKTSKIPGQFFYGPSDDGMDENLLILLHGLGDTHVPFSGLGKSLKLPQTAVLALRAPEQVPFLYDESYQWYTSFDELGETIEHPNPTPAFQILSKIVEHLTGDCAWPISRIHFFGFAQGGSVAAELVLDHWKGQLLQSTSKSMGLGSQESNTQSLSSFGSIISISGPLLSHPTLSTLCPTPILIAHRPPPVEIALPAGSIAAFKKAYQFVTESKMATKLPGMPSSREEWEPIMRFWSQVLSKRQVEGLYEVMTSSSS